FRIFYPAVDMVYDIPASAADVDPGSRHWNNSLFGGHLHEHKIGLSHGLDQRLLLVAPGVMRFSIGEVIENPGYFFPLRRSPLRHCLYPLKTISRILSSSSSLKVNLSLA